jgi:hypothetical protein
MQPERKLCHLERQGPCRAARPCRCARSCRSEGSPGRSGICRPTGSSGSGWSRWPNWSYGSCRSCRPSRRYGSSWSCWSRWPNWSYGPCRSRRPSWRYGSSWSCRSCRPNRSHGSCRSCWPSRCYGCRRSSRPSRPHRPDRCCRACGSDRSSGYHSRESHHTFQQPQRKWRFVYGRGDVSGSSVQQPEPRRRRSIGQRLRRRRSAARRWTHSPYRRVHRNLFVGGHQLWRGWDHHFRLAGPAGLCAERNAILHLRHRRNLPATRLATGPALCPL